MDLANLADLAKEFDVTPSTMRTWFYNRQKFPALDTATRYPLFDRTVVGPIILELVGRKAKA
jgi:hypothetical protein